MQWIHHTMEMPISQVNRSKPSALAHQTQKGCMCEHSEFVFPEIPIQSSQIQDRANPHSHRCYMEAKAEPKMPSGMIDMSRVSSFSLTGWSG